MDRRELLAALAAGAVASPGCLADSKGAGDGSSSATPTQTSTGTPPDATDGETPDDTGTNARTATGDFVKEAFVVPELAAPNSPDSFGVYGVCDEQYVVALLDGAAGWPAVDEISLIAGEPSHDAQDSVGEGGWGLFDLGGAYAPESRASGWVVFSLTNPLAVETATISWPGGQYPLGDESLADLARPPASFEIQSFEAPEAATPGDSITVSLTVENTGDVDGTFVGAVNRNFPAYSPEASIRLPVSAGETERWEREVDVGEVGYDEPVELRLWLYWRDDSADQAVTVEVGTDTPAGTDAQRTGTPATETPATEAPTDSDQSTGTETDATTDTPTATESQPITPEPSE